MNVRPIQTLLSIRFREIILKRCLIRNDFHINYQTLRTISQTLVRREQSNNLGKEHDIGKLKKLFQCTADEATRVYDVLPDHSLEDVVESVNWLKLRNATLPAILDNCHLLLIPLGTHSGRTKFKDELDKTDSFELIVYLSIYRFHQKEIQIVDDNGLEANRSFFTISEFG